MTKHETDREDTSAATGVATFGGGCFWCTEAIFDRVDGVLGVTSGYAGGKTEAPTYKEVCSGTTGHAEVVQVRFDPARVHYEDLLEIFFKTHDPTTRNRQGADVGTQYRSIVLYHSDEQKAAAQAVIRELDAAEVYAHAIVTEVKPFEVFYPAEESHQEYFSLNGDKPYCRAVIQPKVEKFEKVFRERLKARTP